jgi:predicted metal-dependent peptidase
LDRLNGNPELILHCQRGFQILSIRQILAAILSHFASKGQPEKRSKIWKPVFVRLEQAGLRAQ